MPVSLHQRINHHHHMVFVAFFWNVYFSDLSKEDGTQSCCRILYILLHNGMQGARLSKIQGMLQYRTKEKKHRGSSCAKNTVLLERREERLPKAPHLPRLVSLDITNTHNCLYREQARLDLNKQPHLAGMTAGLHNLIWQTLRDGSGDECFLLKHVQESIYYLAELEVPILKIVISHCDWFNPVITVTDACKHCGKLQVRFYFM